MWRDTDGHRFVLWEPKRELVTDAALSGLVQAAALDGLSVDLAPSVWDPPQTVGIRFTLPT